VGERAVEARIRRGETPLGDERQSTSSLRKSTSRVSSATRTRSRRTTRASSSCTESEEEEVRGATQGRRRPAAVYRPPGAESDDEDEGVYLSRGPDSNTSLPTHAAQKPRLPTILSSGYDERAAAAAMEDNDSARPLRDVTNANTRSEPDLSKAVQPALTAANTNLAVAA
jgi:hypothetical protein